MNNTKKILAAGVVLLILTIAVCFAAYQSYQQLKNRGGNPAVIARHAVEARDLETFKKAVDVDKLLERAAEEILTAQINSTLSPTAYSMDELQQRYDKLKPDFTKSARAAAEEYISTGKVSFPKNLTDAQKFFKESGVTSCEIKSISKPQKDGHNQIVTVWNWNRSAKTIGESKTQKVLKVITAVIVVRSSANSIHSTRRLVTRWTKFLK